MNKPGKAHAFDGSVPERSGIETGATTRVVIVAVISNLLVAAVKLAAALWSGSAALVAEGVHSIVDTGNEALILYGLRRSRLPADPEHPLGHGRELYFWSFVVALLIFALGAVAAAAEGVWRLIAPEPISDPTVVYAVLGLSAIFEGVSWWFALHRFGARKSVAGIIEAARKSKDPPAFMVLFEDSAALLGICIAAVGTFLASSLKVPAFDAGASILIGALLGTVAVFLARESKDLLIGERADSAIIDSIKRLAAEQPGVAQANGVFTVHLAPRQIVASFSLEFDDDLRTPQIEAAVAALEKRIRMRHPEVIAIFVKPQSASAFREASAAGHSLAFPG